ncbi:hypothetical protein QJS66_23420 (plasmid) [Kocuria rhizophila]|nr:hypothetical protein QJS66_23420 [Kocuria rhizophila]
MGPHGIAFAVASSSMLLDLDENRGRSGWNLTRGFPSTITWNNFPMPALTDEQRTALASAGIKILDARAQLPTGHAMSTTRRWA